MFRLSARHGPRDRAIGLSTEGLQVRVLPGEPNSKHVNSGAPVVNRFPAQRRFRASAQNPLSCKHFASFTRARPFSVSETGALGDGCNRQGCYRTPRFLPSNSHILWLIRPSG